MASGQLRTFLRQLRHIVGPQGAGGLSDASLLERWVACHDEAAFELLLWRHGPMVFNVCQRLLRHTQDAEDAFQATFLVFVQKAAAIRKHQALGSWLYKVAYRVALRARARAPVLAAHNGECPASRLAGPEDDLLWRDIGPVLDEEVNRLPERYRAAFILCYLEGKTNEEAARELGCPLGTVVSRLARARERLRHRLTRRGLALSGGLMAMVLTRNAASASVSVSLIGSTIKAALMGATKHAAVAGVLSFEAAALTKGVLHAMWMTKIKIAVAAVVTVAVIGAGGGMITYRTLAAAPQDGQSKIAPAAPAANHDPSKLEKPRQEKEDLQRALREAKDRAEALEVKLKESQDQLRHLAARMARLEEELARAKQLLAQNAPAANPTASFLNIRRPDRTETVEQARDEVELLQAHLEVKKTQLKAARVDVDAAHERFNTIDSLHVKNSAAEGEFVQARLDMLKQEALYRVKEAELREPMVRLQQAERRLARLQQAGQAARPSNRARAEKRGTADQRLMELEKKLDNLRQEMEAIRRQLRPQNPAAGRR